VLEKFLMARLSIIIFVAVVDFVIIKAMGLNYAVILSLILGFSTLIPAVGFFLGALPAVSIGLAEGKSPTQVGILFLLIWIVASIQDHFLAPKLLGKHLNLNFLVTYLAIFAGERIWGVAGMFLSVPVLAVIQVILDSSPKYRPLTWLLQGHEADEKKNRKGLPEAVTGESHTVHV
jgi:predicted PurR-regulated permease PerM